MPFPFVEAPRIRERPALIVSEAWQGASFRLYWALMITSIENAGWPDDIDLGAAYVQAGLPAPSVIRPAKITTIVEDSARKLGRLPDDLWGRTIAIVRRHGLT